MNNLDVINNINPNIVKYQEKYYLLISNFLGFNNNPAYGLFILIDNKLFEENNDIQIFFHSLQTDDILELSSLLAEGIPEQFELGTNYFITWSLYQFFMTYDSDNKIKLLSNDYNGFIMQDYFDSQYHLINTNIYENIDDTSLYYFYRINQLQNFEFTLDEFNNFVSTFCGIILDNTTFTNITDTKNLIYKKVLEYYRNNTKDDTSIVLDLIFNNTLLNNTNSTNTTCCNNLQNNTSNINNVDLSSLGLTGFNSKLITTSCVNIYKQSMFNFLVQMLGDYNFYCDWFYIINNIDPNLSIPNIELIHKLKKLFEEFKNLGYTLAWNKDDSICGCKDKSAINQYSSQSIANYKIFDNYYKVLEYAENEEVCLNKNKIKIYGEEFGNILPYIYFI